MLHTSTVMGAEGQNPDLNQWTAKMSAAMTQGEMERLVAERNAPENNHENGVWFLTTEKDHAGNPIFINARDHIQYRVFSFPRKKLCGPIPLNIGVLNDEIDMLYLENNQLTGTLDPLKGLTKLKAVDLSNNQVTGTVESLKGLRALKAVDLSNNQLTGDLSKPAWFPVQEELNENDFQAWSTTPQNPPHNNNNNNVGNNIIIPHDNNMIAD